MVKRAYLATALLAMVAGQSWGQQVKSDPVLTKCQVSAIQKQDVPASDSGILMAVRVKEGHHVTKGQELARVDDREAQALLEVKQSEEEVAKQKSESEIEVLHSKAAERVAFFNLSTMLKANEGVKNAITQFEIEKTKYELKRAEFGITKAEEESIANRLTYKAKKAEVGAAKVAVERRILRAPFDGVVSRISKSIGEWSSPGDRVIELVRVDRLRISGELDAKIWSPSDIENRSVTLEVALPGGKRVSFDGKIVFVSPVVNYNEISITAEADTPMVDERPIVRDGMEATMTIHIGRPAISRATTPTIETR